MSDHKNGYEIVKILNSSKKNETNTVDGPFNEDSKHIIIFPGKVLMSRGIAGKIRENEQ